MLIYVSELCPCAVTMYHLYKCKAHVERKYRSTNVKKIPYSLTRLLKREKMYKFTFQYYIKSINVYCIFIEKLSCSKSTSVQIETEWIFLCSF